MLVTLAACILGGAAAIGLSRKRLRKSAWLETYFLSPLILPTIIFAIGMLMLWSTLFGAPSFTALWICHTAIALPYVLRTTLAVLSPSPESVLGFMSMSRCFGSV